MSNSNNNNNSNNNGMYKVSDAPAGENTIKLVSTNPIVNQAEANLPTDFYVTLKQASISITIHDVTDTTDVTDAEGISLSVPRLMLGFVVEYMQKRNGTKDENIKNTVDITDWEKEFMDRVTNNGTDMVRLHQFILGAYYLAIEECMYLGCKFLANILKTNTREQIKSLYGINRDFTPEEEARARADPAWVEDPSLPEPVNNNNNNNQPQKVQ